MRRSPKPQSNTGTLKIIIAGAVALGGLAFVYSQMREVTPPGPNADADEFARPDFGEMRTRMFDSLDLTPEQREKLDQLELPEPGERGGGWGEGGDNRNWEEFQERRRQMEEILTPEQMEQMRNSRQELMRGRMAERASVLPDDQEELFMEKLEERMVERRRRWENGEPPPWAEPSAPAPGTTPGTTPVDQSGPALT